MLLFLMLIYILCVWRLEIFSTPIPAGNAAAAFLDT